MTTITQDVDDFLQTPYGKEIVTNSSIQILLKQHSAAIDLIGETFYLSEGEKQLLLAAAKGEGIFFAGQNHVAIKVIASEEEHALITSNPEEVMKMKAQKQTLESSIKNQELSIKDETISNNQTPSIPNNNQLPTPNDTNKKPTPAPVAVSTVSEPSKPRFVAEVVGGEAKNDHEEALSKKIGEMEEQEKAELAKFEEQRKVEEEKKKKEEEEKARMGGFGGGSFGGLPKYGDLFKSTGKLPPLPPLPPLPKYQSPISNNQTPSTNNQTISNNQFPTAPTGGQVSKLEEKKTKPIFVNMTEKQIPQPPQLQKKPKPVFKEPTNLESGIKKDDKNEEAGTKKDDKASKSYDELFGNGIV